MNANSNGFGRVRRPLLGSLLLVAILLSFRSRSGSDPTMPVSQTGNGPATPSSGIAGQVNPFTGTYGTAVPIEVLPGRNGLQPALSLSYASASMDGLAGVGWGIPIAFIGCTGPNKGMTTYGPGDEFYMNLGGSSEKLVATAARSGDTQPFETRIASWSKVTAHYLSGSDQIFAWDVISKDGQHFFFGPEEGPTAGTLSFYCYTTYSSTHGKQIFNQWMLRKIEDVDGNSMEYLYTYLDLQPDGTSREKVLYPTLIRYGANERAGYAHTRGVVFSWGTKSITRFSYGLGFGSDFRQTYARRIENIQVGQLDASHERLVSPATRTYNLTYIPSRTTGRDLLTEIDITGVSDSGATTSLPPIIFSYADYPADPVLKWDQDDTAAAAAFPGSPFGYRIPMDAGGNSYILPVSTGSQMMDLNGDGLPDKIDKFWRDDPSSTPGNHLSASKAIYLNQGTSGQQLWNSYTNARANIPGLPLGYYWDDPPVSRNLDPGVRFADVNGDGWVDKIDSLTITDTMPASLYGMKLKGVYLSRKDGSGWDEDPVAVLQESQQPEVFQTQLTLPDGTSNCTDYDAHILVGPDPVVAGGQVFFQWETKTGCHDYLHFQVRTYLEGYDQDWSNWGNNVWRAYQNLPPGNYTFYTQTQIGHAPIRPPIPWPFTVAPMADRTPPQVQIFSPPTGVLLGEYKFRWFTSEGPGTPARTLLTYVDTNYSPPTTQSEKVYPTIDFKGSIDLSDMDTGLLYQEDQQLSPAFTVVVKDASGNMGFAKWSFTGGFLKAPKTFVEWQYRSEHDHDTWKPRDQGIQVADLNGDGYADLFQLHKLNGTFKRQVWLGSPTGWTEAAWNLENLPKEAVFSSWSDVDNISHDWGLRLLDLNGDGLPDLVSFHKYHDENGNDTIRKVVRWNTGSGFTADYTTWSMGDEEDQSQPLVALTEYTNPDRIVTNDKACWIVDINGDGLPDKLDNYYASGEAPIERAWLNQGDGFNNTSSLAPWSTSQPAVDWGHAFAEKARTSTEAPEMATIDGCTRLVDLDGDGLLDFVTKWSNGGVGPGNTTRIVRPGRYMASVTSKRLDFLTEVHDPIGGITQISYTAVPDSYVTHDTLEPGVTPYCPSIPYVVTEVSTFPKGVTDPGTGYKTNYDYYGPKWDAAEKSFAGFRTVTITGPGGQRTETDYRQDFPFTGMVEATRGFASGGTAASTTSTLYEKTLVQEYGGPIYHPHKTVETTIALGTAYAPGSPDLETRVRYSNFDSYDNPGTIYTDGDTSTTADDKRVETTYINNTDLWLIGFVKESTTYSAASGGTKTSGKRLYYDGSSTLGAITLGHVTREDDWLDYETVNKAKVSFNNYLTTATVAYNADGTIDSRTSLGASDVATVTTEFTYESTWPFCNIFPKEKKIQGGYPTTVLSIDPYGRPLSVKDAKGVTRSMVYDGLGRTLSESVAYGSTGAFTVRQMTYENLGSTTSQRVKVTVYPQGTTGDPNTSYMYFDGMGRTWKTETQGWNGQHVYTKTEYDTAGRVQFEYRPSYYFNASPGAWDKGYVENQYDVFGRIQKRIGFGRITTQSYVSPLVTSVTVAAEHPHDPGATPSHTKTTTVDAYGRIRVIQRDSDPEVHYKYDVMGALTEARQGSDSGTLLSSLSYDSWGRKLSHEEYDGAAKTRRFEYFYDHAGHLLRQSEFGYVDGQNPARTTDMTYNYSGLGQILAKTGSETDKPGALTANYTYTGDTRDLSSGELLEATDASGLYHYTYEFMIQPSPRLRTTMMYTGEFGTLSDWTYSTYTDSDLSGRPWSTSLNGHVISYAYQNGSGLLTSVSSGSGNPSATYTAYDETHLTNWSRGNTVATAYTHDPTTDLLTSIQSTKGAASLQNLSYAFTDDGQVRSVTDGVAAEGLPSGFDQGFTYDSKMRMATASGPYGSYGVSNWLNLPGGDVAQTKGDITMNYVGDNTHRVLHSHKPLSPGSGPAHPPVERTSTYGYDGWGNVASRSITRSTNTNSSSLYTFTYDAWGRMESADYDSNPNDPPLRTEYLYNAAGERVRTRIYSNPSENQYLDHIFMGGFEVEDLGNGTIRTRWAVAGANGLVGWKQTIQSQQAFLRESRRNREKVLAAMAWDRFGSGIRDRSRPGYGQGLIAFCKESLRRQVSSGSDLLQAAWHGGNYAAINMDPQRTGLLLLGFLGFGFVWLTLPSRRRRWIERRLLAGAPLPLGLRRRLRQSPSYPAYKGAPGGILHALLSPLINVVQCGLLSSRGDFEALQSRDLAFASSSLPGESRREEDASFSAQPLGLWPMPLFRLTARVLILAFLAHGALFMVSLPAAADPPCYGESFYPLSDQLGNVNTLTDHTGAVVYTQRFLPYGEPFNEDAKVNTCNSNESWPYGFTGQYQDAETGLVYFHARYYLPEIGRFMSPDTVVPDSADTMAYDAYAYCRYNPVNLTDPTGHIFQWAIFWAATAIGAAVGGVMAAVTGQNIFLGMLMGAASGALIGLGPAAQLGGAQAFWASVGAGAVSGALNSAVYGGNILQGAIIGSAGAAIGYGFAQSAVGKAMSATHFGKGALAVMSGGVVGGLSSAAMGGDFWRGFTMGALAAGLSFAANGIASQIEVRRAVQAVSGQSTQQTPNKPVTVQQLADLLSKDLKAIGDYFKNKYGIDVPLPSKENIDFVSLTSGAAGHVAGGKVQINMNTVNYGDELMPTLTDSIQRYRAILVHEVVAHYIPEHNGLKGRLFHGPFKDGLGPEWAVRSSLANTVATQMIAQEIWPGEMPGVNPKMHSISVPFSNYHIRVGYQQGLERYNQIAKYYRDW